MDLPCNIVRNTVRLKFIFWPFEITDGQIDLKIFLEKGTKQSILYSLECSACESGTISPSVMCTLIVHRAGKQVAR